MFHATDGDLPHLNQDLDLDQDADVPSLEHRLLAKGNVIIGAEPALLYQGEDLVLAPHQGGVDPLLLLERNPHQGSGEELLLLQ